MDNTNIRVSVDINVMELSEKTFKQFTECIFRMYFVIYFKEKSIQFRFTRKGKGCFHFVFTGFKYNQMTYNLRNTIIL